MKNYIALIDLVNLLNGDNSGFLSAIHGLAAISELKKNKENIEKNLELVAKAVHQGWLASLNKPHEIKLFSNLLEEEKERHRVIARCLIQLFMLEKSIEKFLETTPS